MLFTFHLLVFGFSNSYIKRRNPKELTSMKAQTPGRTQSSSVFRNFQTLVGTFGIFLFHHLEKTNKPQASCGLLRLGHGRWWFLLAISGNSPHSLEEKWEYFQRAKRKTFFLLYLSNFIKNIVNGENKSRPFKNIPEE